MTPEWMREAPCGVWGGLGRRARGRISHARAVLADPDLGYAHEAALRFLASGATELYAPVTGKKARPHRRRSDGRCCVVHAVRVARELAKKGAPAA
jgi:hypothetical protein